MLLIPGKLYICKNNDYLPFYYMKEILPDLSIIDARMQCLDFGPVLYTGKAFKVVFYKTAKHKFKFCEFIYKNKIIYCNDKVISNRLIEL